MISSIRPLVSLNRGFIGFSAAVGKKYLIRKRKACQFRGQFDLRVCIKQVGNVDKFAGVFVDRSSHFRVTMPEAAHCYPGQKIEVFLPGIVP